MLVARGELDYTLRRKFARLGFRRREPFIKEGPDDGALHRSAHVHPFDRRTGVQDEVGVHTRNLVAGVVDADEHRVGRLDLRDGFRVPLVRLIRVQPVERLEQGDIPARSRRPVVLDDVRPLPFDIF